MLLSDKRKFYNLNYVIQLTAYLLRESYISLAAFIKNDLDTSRE